MNRFSKVLGVIGTLCLTTGASCQPIPSDNGAAGPKPCFAVGSNGTNDYKKVDLVWDTAVRPFAASGYAKDSLNIDSTDVINFDEIVTAKGPYKQTLWYHSGCVIKIMLRASNEGKSGMAYVKIQDGPANTCEKHEDFVRSLRCDLNTNR